MQRRGNNQPDLLNVKAQKDASGKHCTHRIHRDGDINTTGCGSIFSDICNIKQLEQVSCSVPTGFVVSSTLTFPVFFLSLSPPTHPLSVPLCFSSSFHFIFRTSAWFKVDLTRNNEPINQGLIFHNVSVIDIWMCASQMLQHPKLIFPLSSITAKFQFFDSLILLAIRACCSTYSGK